MKRAAGLASGPGAEQVLHYLYYALWAVQVCGLRVRKQRDVQPADERPAFSLWCAPSLRVLVHAVEHPRRRVEEAVALRYVLVVSTTLTTVKGGPVLVD